MMMISNTTGKGKELCKDLESFFFFFFFSQSFISRRPSLTGMGMGIGMGMLAMSKSLYMHDNLIIITSYN